MGKRSSSGNGGGSSKRQRCHTVVEPGQYGIYASCSIRKETAGGRELRDILSEVLKDEKSAVDEDDGKDGKELSVEDAVEKELAEIRKEDSKNGNGLFRGVPLGVESLLFFQIRKPLIPSEVVTKICDNVKNGEVKGGRYVQRLVPIDMSCNASETEIKKLIHKSVKDYVDKHGKEVLKEYNVNLIRRQFDTIERDTFLDIVKEIIEEETEQECQLRYKGATTLLHIYCYRNNVGISITPQETFDKYSKLNLQSLNSV